MSTLTLVCAGIATVLGLAGLIRGGTGLLASRGGRRCPSCGYDMSAVPGRVCPECGRAASSERRMQRIQPRWRQVAAGVVLLALAGGVSLLPRLNLPRNMPKPLLVATAWVWESKSHVLFEELFRRNLDRELKVSDMRSWERWMLMQRCAYELEQPEPGPALTPWREANPPCLYAWTPDDAARFLVERTNDTVRQIAPRLERIAAQPGHRNRLTAIRLLAHASAPRPETLVVVGAAVDDGDPYIALAAAVTLGAWTVDDPRVEETLIAGLRSSNSVLRDQAFEGVLRIRSGRAEVLQVVRELASDGTNMARALQAVQTLASADAPPGSVDAPLARLVIDLPALDDLDRGRLQDLVGRRPPAIVGHIAAALGENPPQDPGHAFAIMAVFPEEAIPRFVEYLRHPNPVWSEAAVERLAELAPAYPQVEAPLRDTALFARGWPSRSRALFGISRLPSTEPATRAALGRVLLEDSNHSIRAMAVSVAGELALSDPALVLLLAAALDDTDTAVRAAAAEILGTLGSAGVPALPALGAAASDPDPRVARLAAESVRQIEIVVAASAEQESSSGPRESP